MIFDLINIKQILIDTIFSYAIGWIYYFITLPFIVKIFGVFNGMIINYIISWGIMLGIIYLLQTVPILSIV